MDGLLARIDRDFFATVAGLRASARQAAILDGVAEHLPALMAKFSIMDELRIAHFTAQICHESDAFSTTEEYASGAAYEGREDLGNNRPGDGVRYKGRALIQVTGRGNYEKFTLWMRGIDANCPDFVAEPERLEEFPWAAWGAVWYWWTRSLSVLAERDDLIGITKRVNGGTNGLKWRGIYLARAKSAIAKLAAAAVTETQDGFPVLHRADDRAEMVEGLQRLLTMAGFYHLAIDGDFGAGTEGAVRLAQSTLGLKVDGLAGRATYNALLALLELPTTSTAWTSD